MKNKILLTALVSTIISLSSVSYAQEAKIRILSNISPDLTIDENGTTFSNKDNADGDGGATEPELTPLELAYQRADATGRRMCSDIRLQDNSLPDGVYEVDPDGGGPSFSTTLAHCDMTSGYTLIDDFGLNSPYQAAYSSQNINSLNDVIAAGYEYALIDRWQRAAYHSESYSYDGPEDGYFSYFAMGRDQVGWIGRYMPSELFTGETVTVKVNYKNPVYGSTAWTCNLQASQSTGTISSAGNNESRSVPFTVTASDRWSLSEYGTCAINTVWVL